MSHNLAFNTPREKVLVKIGEAQATLEREKKDKRISREEAYLQRAKDAYRGTFLSLALRYFGLDWEKLKTMSEKELRELEMLIGRTALIKYYLTMFSLMPLAFTVGLISWPAPPKYFFGFYLPEYQWEISLAPTSWNFIRSKRLLKRLLDDCRFELILHSLKKEKNDEQALVKNTFTKLLVSKDIETARQILIRKRIRRAKRLVGIGRDK